MWDFGKNASFEIVLIEWDKYNFFFQSKSPALEMRKSRFVIVIIRENSSFDIRKSLFKVELSEQRLYEFSKKIIRNAFKILSEALKNLLNYF